MEWADCLAFQNKGHTTIIIYEDNRMQESQVPALKLLQEACLRFGSSLQGRIDSFCHLTGSRQKACIYVNPAALFIPNQSMKAEDTWFLNYHRILNVKGVEEGTRIMFDDGTVIVLPCDARIIRKQQERCRSFIDKLYDNYEN